MAPFEFQRRPANPLRVSRVLKRSRCGALRISTSSGKPSAGFARVEALSLWRPSNFNVVRQTLCGFRACRRALVVAPFKFQRRPANPLRVSRVLKRSRCGALRISTSSGKPSAGFVHVEGLSLWRPSNFNVVRQTLCGFRACQRTRVVAACEFQRRPANPLRVSRVLKRSRCGALRISTSSGKPSAGFARVEALSPWRPSNFNVVRQTLCGFRAC